MCGRVVLVGRRKAGGAWRGSSTRLHLHRARSLSPRRLLAREQRRMRARLQRALVAGGGVAAHVRGGATLGASAAAAGVERTAPHAPACHAREHAAAPAAAARAAARACAPGSSYNS
ncbi:hypothetical protein B5X24_HaOG206951 [Helicoverpa armigera]|nr:hypothetical protein B5X24_HaOG206951 [Helicoverpa armigera]